MARPAATPVGPSAGLPRGLWAGLPRFPGLGCPGVPGSAPPAPGLTISSQAARSLGRTAGLAGDVRLAGRAADEDVQHERDLSYYYRLSRITVCSSGVCPVELLLGANSDGGIRVRPRN